MLLQYIYVLVHTIFVKVHTPCGAHPFSKSERNLLILKINSTSYAVA